MADRKSQQAAFGPRNRFRSDIFDHSGRILRQSRWAPSPSGDACRRACGLSGAESTAPEFASSDRLGSGSCRSGCPAGIYGYRTRCSVRSGEDEPFRPSSVESRVITKRLTPRKTSMLTRRSSSYTTRVVNDKTYLPSRAAQQRNQLAEKWAKPGHGRFDLLSPLQQWALHDYYRFTQPWDDLDSLALRQAVLAIDPSLPQ